MGPLPSEFAKLGRALRSWRAGALATAALIAAVLFRAFSGQARFFSAASRYDRFPEFSGARLPHYSPLTPSFLNSIWPLVIAAIILTLIAIRLAQTIAIARKNNLTQKAGEESGSSAVEFVLILPMLVVLLLMVLQIALIVQAKFVVNYAAFCAARSAIVIIPDDVSSAEPRNRLTNPDTSQKIEIIHHAAALPLTAISPLPGFSFSRGIPVLTDPNAIAELWKLAPFDVGPQSKVVQVTLRAPYAYHKENTAVKVLTQQGNEGGSFEEHDWVTVKVSYRYFLAVPFAKKLFGTSYFGGSIVPFFGSDYYYPIVEQYTLPMDGEPPVPE